MDNGQNSKVPAEEVVEETGADANTDETPDLRPCLHKNVFASKCILTSMFMPSVYTKWRSKCIVLKTLSKVYHSQNATFSFACKSQLTIMWPLDKLIPLKHIMYSKLLAAIWTIR